jgi:hypothetical protein
MREANTSTATQRHYSGNWLSAQIATFRKSVLRELSSQPIGSTVFVKVSERRLWFWAFCFSG